MKLCNYEILQNQIEVDIHRYMNVVNIIEKVQHKNTFSARLSDTPLINNSVMIDELSG